MEQGKGDRSEGGDNIPDDISDLVESIYGRDDQRQKAVLMNLENASIAESQEERDYWLTKAMEMGEIAKELRDQFPELFPEE
jgi:hypothetical protein